MGIFKRPFFKYFSAIIIILIIVTIILYYKRFFYPFYKGRIYCGVESEISIERNKNGIPFVKAKTINDAYFAIGFLHGQDRLALAEFFKAVANGRLAGMIGEEGLLLDKLSLTLGFARKAEVIAGGLKNQYAGYINAYINGINAARKIVQNDSSIAAEWTVEDAVSILLLFEWADSFLNNTELVFPLPDKLNTGILKNIIPEKLLFQYSEEERTNVNLLIEIRNAVKKWIGQFQEGFAFFIRSEKMHDGKSVSGFTLDSDMSIYTKWYPVSLTVGNNRIDGITASGLPFIFFGRNDNITFSGFNLNADTQTFYLDKIKIINNTKQYYRNGTWQNFNIINERLYSNHKQNKEEGIILPVMATDIGPVLSDLAKQENDVDCISVSFLLPDQTYINALFDIPEADSIIKAKRIVRNVNSLPKIYLFSINKEAECIYSGKITANKPGRMFRNGMTFDSGTIADISGYGYKISGDSLIIGNNIFEKHPGIYPDRIIYYDMSRYNKYSEFLRNKNLLTSKDIVTLLCNTHSITAEKFMPLLLPLLKQIQIPSAKLCGIYFNNWDYNMNSESIAATIFNTLLVSMIEETIDDEIGKSTAVLLDRYYLLLDNYYNLLSGNSSLFDDKGTDQLIESKENIFHRAFTKSLRRLNKEYGPKMENWKWVTVHKGHFIIPSRERKFFWQKRELGNIGVPGDNSTINKGGISAVNLLKPVNISILSAIFYLDYHLSFFNLSLSSALNTQSEYDRNYSMGSNFISLDAAEIQHKLVLLPNKK